MVLRAYLKKKERNWVIWIHCCISFQLGFCCCSDWHIWAHVADSRTVHILLSWPPALLRFMLQGVWGPRSRSGLCCSGWWSQQPEAACASVRNLLGTTRTGTCGDDLYNVTQPIYHREENSQTWGVPALCPPPRTVLPLSFFFSYFFLYSFILDSTSHNSLYCLDCFSPSSSKPLWKICQTFFGANANLVAVFKFSVISFCGE